MKVYLTKPQKVIVKDILTITSIIARYIMLRKKL